MSRAPAGPGEQMKIIDITGPIHAGMWSYGPPYPPVEVELLPSPDWVPHPTYSWKLQITAQTGTYLENARHMSLDAPPLDSVPIEQLVLRPAAVIAVPRSAGQAIDLADLLEAAACMELEEGLAILVATGWGSQWDAPDFVSGSPYFTRDAMDWLLDHKPFMIGADLPRFDSSVEPQLFFPDFFRRGVLLLAPLVNLEQIPVSRGYLIALPLRVQEVGASPCRAVFCWEDESG